MNCIVKIICICVHHPILLRWFNLKKKDEVGGVCYVQDEQDVDKHSVLKTVKKADLKCGQIKYVHLDVEI
jgi:hypothetical protein